LVGPRLKGEKKGKREKHKEIENPGVEDAELDSIRANLNLAIKVNMVDVLSIQE
jgi:hypothetical protein